MDFLAYVVPERKSRFSNIPHQRCVIYFSKYFPGASKINYFLNGYRLIRIILNKLKI